MNRAIDLGIDLVYEKEADDYFCFVISDANLRRFFFFLFYFYFYFIFIFVYF